MNFLLLTYFFLAAISSKSKIPSFVHGNLPSQNPEPEMRLKMTVIHLMSFHLGVPCPHLSELSLLTTGPLETSQCHSELHSLPFTPTSPLGLEVAHQPLEARRPLMVPGAAQHGPGTLSILPVCPYHPSCLSLLAPAVHTRAEEKSFYLPSNILSSPYTHNSLYPLAPSLALSFFK